MGEKSNIRALCICQCQIRLTLLESLYWSTTVREHLGPDTKDGTEGVNPNMGHLHSLGETERDRER